MTQAPQVTWRSWLMWGLGAGFFFYAFLQRTSTSVLVPDLMRAFDVGASALGGLSGFYFYAYFLVQLPTGLMTDRFGPRRLLALAALVSAAGGLLFASADGLTMAGIGRFFVGAGAGFAFVCTLRIATDWFPPERLAMLSGMTMMIGMTGGVTGQAPLAFAVGAFGWRPTMAAIALIGLVVAVVVWLIAKEQRPQGRATGTGDQGGTRVLAGLAIVLKRGQTWILAGYGFAITVVMFAFGGLWAVPFLQQIHGFSRPDAAFAGSLILLGWGLFAPLVGWASDRWRRRKLPLVAAALASLITIVPVVFMTELSAMAIRVLLFANGVAMAGMVASFAAVREHNDTAHAGTSMAFVNMSLIGAGAVMQPVVGWLLDLGWQGTIVDGVRVYSLEAYQNAFLVLPASCAAALVLALMVRETHGKPQVAEYR